MIVGGMSAPISEGVSGGIMHQVVAWLSSNTATLSILGAAIAFVWSTTQQIIQRRAEAREREFQTFHRLVRDLVSPDSADGKIWEDRQAAVAFELRHFPRYYEFTERMLLRLRSIWGSWPRLVEEIDLTLRHIKQNR
jgi:hypothetical protein